MIYITGDTHGDFTRLITFCKENETSINDIMIILGDVGVNYFGKWKDQKKKCQLSELPITVFCIHGNHENKTSNIITYEQKRWNGGEVYFEQLYPNILFAMDGEVFNLGILKVMVIGGAYSVDKFYRLWNGYGWWEDEQPSDIIKAYVELQLASLDNKVDVVLSHTCPLKYEPVEVFLSFIDQTTVDKSTEIWLDTIESNLEYKKWYCGHYHVEKVIDKMKFLFESIVEFI